MFFYDLDRLLEKKCESVLSMTGPLHTDDPTERNLHREQIEWYKEILFFVNKLKDKFLIREYAHLFTKLRQIRVLIVCLYPRGNN